MITPVHGSSRYAVVYDSGGHVVVAAVHAVHLDDYMGPGLVISVRNDGVNDLPPWYETPKVVRARDVVCLVPTSEAAAKHRRNISEGAQDGR